MVEKNQFSKIKKKLTEKIGTPFFEADNAIIFNGDTLEIFMRIA